MGTRADFYNGLGTKAEWLGSIAWDGDTSVPRNILLAKDEASFKAAVSTFLASRDDGTTPDMGWPWPWEDSHTTDCTYSFTGTKIRKGPKKTDVFPDMKDRQKVTLGARSGVIVIGPRAKIEDLP